MLNTSLKYMGLGSFAPKQARAASPQATDEPGEASGSAPATKTPSRAGWTRFVGAGAGAQEKGEPSGAAADDDDRKIRFTIGGEGKRMNKEDFIREVQKLDAKTRKQVIDQSSASQRVKSMASMAKEEPAATAVPRVLEQPPSTEGQSSGGKEPVVPHGPKPSEQTGETAAERRRRMAVLATQGDDDEEGETPAERRRREAALGMGDDGEESDDESRTTSGMRIRFAEPERGRR